METGTLQRCITHDPERDQIHISFSQKEEASSGEDFIIFWLDDALIAYELIGDIQCTLIKIPLSRNKKEIFNW